MVKPWAVGYWLVVAGFLAVCATWFHPDRGFTDLIRFTEDWHDRELAEIQALPHLDQAPGFHDGSFYAQLAIDPLLRDPALPQALDAPVFRARRILVPVVAHLAGFGRPSWILQAESVLNIAVWLMLAWLLARWIPPTGPRNFALWTGSLLAHGLIVPVTLALTDGMMTLLLVMAVAAAERNRHSQSSVWLSLAVLSRETAAFAALIYARAIDRDPRTWWRAAKYTAAAAAVPALWFAYVKIMLPGSAISGVGHFGFPLEGLANKLARTWASTASDGLTLANVGRITALAGFFAQTILVCWYLVVKRNRSEWVLLGSSFLITAALMQGLVWNGAPGGFTRILYPLGLACNVLLARERRPSWALIAVINLGVWTGLVTLFRQG